CPRHPPGRSSRLALVHPPPRAGQYHHHSAAAEVPRPQPGRERLAVHAGQLALQPHFQILRRSRRPLLCGMEQARRSALAHHVHRTAPMGPRVLINGIWYKTHSSTTDPEAKLAKKGKGKEAKLAYTGNVMTENCNGFVVEAELRQVSGMVERETAKD